MLGLGLGLGSNPQDGPAWGPPRRRLWDAGVHCLRYRLALVADRCSRGAQAQAAGEVPGPVTARRCQATCLRGKAGMRGMQPTHGVCLPRHAVAKLRGDRPRRSRQVGGAAPSTGIGGMRGGRAEACIMRAGIPSPGIDHRPACKSIVWWVSLWPKSRELSPLSPTAGMRGWMQAHTAVRTGGSLRGS